MLTIEKKTPKPSTMPLHEGGWGGGGESRVGPRVVRPTGYAALRGMRERGMAGEEAAGVAGVRGWGEERAQAGAKRHEAA